MFKPESFRQLLFSILASSTYRFLHYLTEHDIYLRYPAIDCHDNFFSDLTTSLGLSNYSDICLCKHPSETLESLGKILTFCWTGCLYFISFFFIIIIHDQIKS